MELLLLCQPSQSCAGLPAAPTHRGSCPQRFCGVGGTEGGLSLLITGGWSSEGPFNPGYSTIPLEKTAPCLAAGAEPGLLEASWRSPGPQLSRGKAVAA